MSERVEVEKVRGMSDGERVEGEDGDEWSRGEWGMG